MVAVVRRGSVGMKANLCHCGNGNNVVISEGGLLSVLHQQRFKGQCFTMAKGYDTTMK